MSTQIVDLWPEKINTKIKKIAPVTILRQQASLLGKKTKNIVEGQVETRTVKDSYEEKLLEHSFYVVAPVLDFYKYPLFRVQHGILDWYPLKIFVDVIDSKSFKEKGWDVQNMKRRIRLKAASIGTETEEEFIEKLKEIFALEETQQAIGSLIAQSQAWKTVLQEL
jgi:hypothetical protein